MADEQWDLVVVGGGAAGTRPARVAGQLGFKTALIEQDRLGGSCSWLACVPSKTLLQAAETYWHLQHGPGSGIKLSGGTIDPSGALEWVREVVNHLGRETSPQTMAEKGVQVIRGTGTFEDEHTVRVGDRTIAGRRIVLATGSRPALPEIDGLEEAGYLTNETLFDLPEPPRSMLIVGGGPVGVEMSQAFNRLGTDVTVFEHGDRILGHDDAELAQILSEHLTEEGVRLVLNAKVTRVERGEDGLRTVTAMVDGAEQTFTGAELLIATGREVVVDRLHLDRAGVRGDSGGVKVNDRLQTDNPDIYAAGDVLGRWQFTHIANIEGRLTARNALLGADEPMRYDAAGWCTFTEPALASVGINEAQAAEQGIEYELYRITPGMADRARIEGRAEGAVKIIGEPGGGRILGAQILAGRAGDIIQEFTAAVSHGVPARDLANDVHMYPTLVVGHYAGGQMKWEQFRKDPERLAEIRDRYGFAGISSV